MDYSYDDTKGPTAWYRMKTNPKHLPPRKQQELDAVVKAILARHDVEMIILFGSHARGDWVEDRYEEDHITYEYRSDFDILIVTADKEREHAVNQDNSLRDELEPAQGGTRVNFIVHTIHYLNQKLAERRFFFMDILKDGFLLHDAKRYKLIRPPKALPPAMMLEHATEYFEEWMGSADGFFKMANTAMSEKELKISAFLHHQSAERYITCLLLVHTGYRPKEHDMEKLLRQAAGIDPRYDRIFPNNTKEEKHLFDLLRRAYVDARYSKNYRITEKELTAIAERIQQLKAVTTNACEKKIAMLERAVAEEGNPGEV